MDAGTDADIVVPIDALSSVAAYSSIIVATVIKERLKTIRRVPDASCVIKERIDTDGRVVAARCVEQKCAAAHSSVLNPGGIALESRIPARRVKVSAGVAQQRICSKGSVVTGGIERQSAVAKRAIVKTGVTKKGNCSKGAISICVIAKEGPRSESRVEAAC